MDRVLLITGGSSGIGKAAVQLFVSHGWRVFELSRHGQNSEGVMHFDCDVCDDKSVADAVANVMSATDHLDVLVSNAGFGISGAIEFTEMADAKRQFDVNFFGALAVTKAVLPYMRKQGFGTIVYTSSVAAVLSIPYQAFYSASKSAINAMALALQNEVRDFGIKVSVVMPGDVATGFTANREKSIAGEEVYTRISKAVATMEKDEQSGMTPMLIARVIYKAATRKNPAPQYVGGFQYKIFCLLDRILPKRLVNWIVGKLY